MYTFAHYYNSIDINITVFPMHLYNQQYENKEYLKIKLYIINTRRI